MNWPDRAEISRSEVYTLMDDLVVHFPWMNPGLAGPDLPEWVLWLDPGVALPEGPARWRPPTLPYSDEEVRRMVREYLQFAERFPKTSDMQAYRAAGIDNFYTDTTMDILSQLTGGAKSAEVSLDDALRQAQIVLALALFREEHFMGMRDQETRFAQARDGFARTLGLGDEESFAELGVSDDVLFPRAGVDLPWKSLLPRVFAFLPGGASLFVSDADVFRELEACGLAFAPCVVKDRDFWCCDMDAAGLELVCGERVELPHFVRILANPSNPSTSENR